MGGLDVESREQSDMGTVARSRLLDSFARSFFICRPVVAASWRDGPKGVWCTTLYGLSAHFFQL